MICLPEVNFSSHCPVTIWSDVEFKSTTASGNYIDFQIKLDVKYVDAAGVQKNSHYLYYVRSFFNDAAYAEVMDLYIYGGLQKGDRISIQAYEYKVPKRDNQGNLLKESETYYRIKEISLWNDMMLTDRLREERGCKKAADLIAERQKNVAVKSVSKEHCDQSLRSMFRDNA